MQTLTPTPNDQPAAWQEPCRGVRWHLVLPAGAVLLGAFLQFFRAGAGALDFDESFTATAGRMRLGALLHFIRFHDTHPPLDYLLRAPLARAGVSPFMFRLPSMLAAVAALLVFALWMRRYGRLGCVATIFFAIGSYQLTYGRDARMYALLGLAGVAGARLSDDWLRRPSRRLAVAIGGVALAAMLLQAGGLAVVVGFFAVPGIRRDRAAWDWRTALAGAGVLWAGLWGPSFLTQLTRNQSHWIPLATPHSVLTTLNELVDVTPVIAAVVVGLLALGAIALLSRRSPLARVWLACGLLPMGLVVAIGFHSRVLLPRTLAPEAWAMLVALAALVDLVWSRWWLLGVGLALLVLSLSLPSTVHVLWASPAPQQAAFSWVEGRAANGDTVAIHPGWLGPLVEWQFDARRSGSGRVTAVNGIDSDAVVLGGGKPSGRVWWVDSTAYPARPPGMVACGPSFSSPDFDVAALCPVR